MIAKIFNTYIYSLENPYSIFENSNDISIPISYFNNGNLNTPENEDEESLKLSQERMSMIRKCSYKLTISVSYLIIAYSIEIYIYIFPY